MSKKIIAVAILPLFVLVLSGCSKKDDAKNQNQNQNGQSINEMGGQNGNKPENKGQGKNPPAELTSACENKNEGDSCEFTMPQEGEKLTGTCKKSQDGSSTICMPDNMPQKPGPGAGADDQKK